MIRDIFANLAVVPTLIRSLEEHNRVEETNAEN